MEKVVRTTSATLLLMGAASACEIGIGAPLGPETSAVTTAPAAPRMRVGSIPFPGLLTLYAVADPRSLGSHRYERLAEDYYSPDETERGILYTRRAGFLDLSHIRESMDIVKYAHDRIVERLADPKAVVWTRSSTFTMQWADSRYEVEVRVPKWWGALGASDRTALSREAAIRQAQRFAVIIGAWHELGTWYGQMTILPFSEKNSAFTWDDPASHIVAAIVAGRALRDDGARWNQAVTKALGEVLKDLGVVDIECESEAVERVHGRWWRNGKAIRRDLEVGVATIVKQPWLVSGPGCWEPHAGAPSPLVMPEMSFAGRNLQELFEVRIRPPRWLMAKALGCEQCPEALINEQQLVDAIERLRVEIRNEFGPDADQP